MSILFRKNGQKRSEGENRNFSDYYRVEVVQHALQKGVIFSGTVRIHQKNYKEAYVSMPGNYLKTASKTFISQKFINSF